MRSMENFRQQLGSNPRLQIGLLLSMVLVFAIAVQALDGWRKTQQQRAIQSELALRKARQMQKQDIWQSRSKETTEAKTAILNEIPTVATPGMAQAQMQTWLQSLGKTLETDKEMRISVSAPLEIEAHPGIYQIRATVTMSSHPAHVFAFMDMVESAANLAAVETSQVISTANNIGATINIIAYYRSSETDAGSTP